MVFLQDGLFQWHLNDVNTLHWVDVSVRFLLSYRSSCFYPLSLSEVLLLLFSLSVCLLFILCYGHVQKSQVIYLVAFSTFWVLLVMAIQCQHTPRLHS